MRRFLAGIFLLSCLIPGVALAETKGEVQNLGFGWNYRPNCHTPMLVRVQADKSGTYQIRVLQEDMDRDQEIFVQTVSLTGADEGTVEQRFWLYFIPQPTNGGLHGLSSREIQQQLKVFLCDDRGRQICQLPVTQTVISIDNAQVGPAPNRGSKLIVAVSDTGAEPVWRDYQYALGTLEDVVFVKVRSAELPEDVRGYEAVDAIVWLNAPAPDAAKPAEEKRHHAIREYVRGGGHLVICQPAQREATGEWDDLMPVTVKEIAPRNDLEPLRTLARAEERKQERDRARREDIVGLDPDKGPTDIDWDRAQGPYMFARAELKKGAYADQEHMVRWSDTDKTPYIARGGYGAGGVTWVAQDLADPAIISRAKSGWPFVWDRVLGFNDSILLIDQKTGEPQKFPFASAGFVDLGFALLPGMELTSKSRALVSIAVVFFIAYWVVAGPGVYLWLVTKSRSQLSWFMFGLSALVATALTVMVVKLVVRGPPELSHVTVVRATPGEPSIAMSQFGLYIPRDGSQELALPQVAPKNVSYLTGFPAHPSNPQGEMDFPARMPYLVPLRDASSDDPVQISVPFRSTLKKFQVRYVGATGGIVDGSAKLRFDERSGQLRLDGIITNGTGNKLRNVYIVYHDPEVGEDFVLYQPDWDPQSSIDLFRDFAPQRIRTVAAPSANQSNLSGAPEDKVRLRGRISSAGGEIDWSDYWFSGLRSGSATFGNRQQTDLGSAFNRSFPMMSLFGRLPVMKNSRGEPKKDGTRSEIIRRGGRHLDVSAAVAAGRLVVLAEADEKMDLPFPLEVEGEKVTGKGQLFYQFILPLEHVPTAATTQPGGTTQPAPTPTAGEPTAVEPLAAEPVASPPDPSASGPGAAAADGAFDPAKHVGGRGNLTNQQWMQVLRYRRQQAIIEARQQKLQREQQQQPAR